MALELGKQGSKGFLNMLRYGSDFRQNRHEIVIIIPAWHNVDVQMIIDSCSCNRAQVEADVKAIWLKYSFQNCRRCLYQ